MKTSSISLRRALGLTLLLADLMSLPARAASDAVHQATGETAGVRRLEDAKACEPGG